MEMDTTFEKVRALLASQLNLEPEKITLASDIIADLGADSIDLFEMLMHMDEEFNISLPEDKAKNIKTVGNLVDFINEAKNIKTVGNLVDFINELK